MVGRNARARRHRVLGEPQRASGRVLAPVSRLSTAHGCSAPPVHTSKCGRSARVRIRNLVPDLRLPSDTDYPACVKGVDARGTPLHCMATLQLVAPRQPARRQWNEPEWIIGNRVCLPCHSYGYRRDSGVLLLGFGASAFSSFAVTSS